MLLFDRIRQFRAGIASLTLLSYLGTSSPVWAYAISTKDSGPRRPAGLPYYPPPERQSGGRQGHQASQKNDGGGPPTIPAAVTAAASEPSTSTVSGQTLALPSGPGTVGGSGDGFSAESSTGTGTLSVP